MSAAAGLPDLAPAAPVVRDESVTCRHSHLRQRPRAHDGIRRDDSVTRERRTLRARYRLVDAGTGAVVLDATAGSDAGIDVVSSEYATVAAEQTALERLSKEVADQIVTRIAVFGLRSGTAQ